MRSDTAIDQSTSNGTNDRARRRSLILLTLCVLPALVLLLVLGNWQVQRLQWKTDLIARAERLVELAPVPFDTLEPTRANDFTPVVTSGEWLTEHSFRKGVVAHDNELGALLVTPLLRQDGEIVMVERGWVPEESDAGDFQPPQDGDVEGVVRFHARGERNPFTPQNDPDANRLYWYDFAALEQEIGAPISPLVLAVQPDGAVARPPVPQPVRVDFRNNHLGYAVTWFGLAAALVVIYLAYIRHHRRG